MTSATPIPSESAFELAGRSVRRVDAFWVAVVRSVDGLLRSYYRIEEFTDDPDCLFRTALCRAAEPVELSDGTQIHRGQMIVALHWWNEHLQRYSEDGPNVRWASDMQRRIRHSLRLLAMHVEQDSTWQTIEAFRADAFLSSRLGGRQIRRVAGRYGFEVVEPGPSLVRRLDAFAASVDSWALTRAFNPAARSRQPLLRARHQLWISRTTLLRRHRHAERQLTGRRPHRLPAASNGDGSGSATRSRLRGQSTGAGKSVIIAPLDPAG